MQVRRPIPYGQRQKRFAAASGCFDASADFLTDLRGRGLTCPLLTVYDVASRRPHAAVRLRSGAGC
jgi:hypothetical protein